MYFRFINIREFDILYDRNSWACLKGLTRFTGRVGNGWLYQTQDFLQLAIL